MINILVIWGCIAAALVLEGWIGLGPQYPKCSTTEIESACSHQPMEFLGTNYCTCYLQTFISDWTESQLPCGPLYNMESWHTNGQKKYVIEFWQYPFLFLKKEKNERWLWRDLHLCHHHQTCSKVGKGSEAPLEKVVDRGAGDMSVCHLSSGGNRY